MEPDNLEKLMKLKSLCVSINKNPENSLEELKNLRELLLLMPQQVIKSVSPLILTSLYHFIKPPDDKLSFKENQMIIAVDTLTVMFERSRTEKVGLFYNVYAFLLNEVYDHNKKNLIKDVSEEYKLSVLNCMRALTDSLSWDILMNVYSKDNAPKLSQMLYLALEIAKCERYRNLRIAGIECIMSIARVNNEQDMTDVELSNQIAEVFMFFLPGLSSGLRSIALEDEKIGHKIAQVAVKAWGRIVNLLMKDYNPAEQKISMTELQNVIEEMYSGAKDVNTEPQDKWKSDAEIKEYIENSKRSPEWYKGTDDKLQQIVHSMKKLSHYAHPNVRSELASVCSLLLENCSNTMPKSMSIIVEILITLSEDDYEDIAKKCGSALTDLTTKFSSDLFKRLLENLEENFYNALNAMPRIFNGIDEQEQLASLKLLGGYLRLFGKYKLVEVLYSPPHLQRLITGLIHICELEKAEVRLLEEFTIRDLDTSADFRTPWKRFRYFSSDSIKNQLLTVCAILSQPTVVDIVTDFLLDVYLNDYEHRKEATLLLSEILSGDCNAENYHIIKNVLHTYLEPQYWDLPVTVTTDEYGNKYSLPQVQNNVVQICLQVEGVGKMALALECRFQEFLLKSLYAVLEKAGSGKAVIRAAGLSSVSNITIACGYTSVTELINENSDYFAYHVIRKLRISEHNESVLSVLGVVMKHSTMEVLPSISDIVDGVLMQSCDEHQDKNASSFLRVFHIFIKCLIRWLDVKVEIKPFRNREQKEKEQQEFQVSNLRDSEDFSDDTVGKSAEETFTEDMQKRQEELEDDEYEAYRKYEKPDPPMHIKLTVSILKRSLHFLPSKDRERKLLVLEILKDGLEVVRDWEDELLPIVHQIWSPLVDRFKEFKEPLIINYAFRLLVTLARLSKDFIRSRTAKEVLPSLLKTLEKLSHESHLKDKGSAYRYTQAYKLQIELLQHLGRLVCDLDMSSVQILEIIDALVPYLSDKQPLPLQNACVELFKMLAFYDVNPVREKLLKVEDGVECEVQSDCRKNVQMLNRVLLDEAL